MTMPANPNNNPSLDGLEDVGEYKRKVMESAPGYVRPTNHGQFPNPAFGSDKAIIVGQTDDPMAPNYIDPKHISSLELNAEPPPLPLNEFRVLRRYEQDSKTGKTTRIVITIDNPPSEDAIIIMRELVPDWLRQFGWKNKDYATEGEGAFHTADLLGARGQFADMWRKMGKLYRALWEGRQMKAEKPEEMVTDLIGHCFLTLNYLSKKDDK